MSTIGGGATNGSGEVLEAVNTMSAADMANELVRVLCTEIRAMAKGMRIFCANLLT